jgi:hypothetical protein
MLPEVSCELQKSPNAAQVDIDSFDCELLRSVLDSGFRAKVIEIEVNPIFVPSILYSRYALRIATPTYDGEPMRRPKRVTGCASNAIARRPALPGGKRSVTTSSVFRKDVLSASRQGPTVAHRRRCSAHFGFGRSKSTPPARRLSAPLALLCHSRYSGLPLVQASMMRKYGYTLIQYDFDSAIYVQDRHLETLEAAGVFIHPLGALFLRGNERWFLCSPFLWACDRLRCFSVRTLDIFLLTARCTRRLTLLAEIPAAHCAPDCVPRSGHHASAYGDSSLNRELLFESNQSVVAAHYIAALQELAPSWTPESSSALFRLDPAWQPDALRTRLLP